MNKFIRTFLIIFAVCVAIGGGTLIAGIAMGGTLDDASVRIGGDYPWFMTKGEHGLIQFGDDDDDDYDYDSDYDYDYDDDDDSDDDYDDDNDPDDNYDDRADKKADAKNFGEGLTVDAAGIADLEMAFSNCNLEILPSSDNTIRVEVEESKKKYISMKQDGKTLKIKDTRKKKNLMKLKSIKLKMYVPDSQIFDEVDLDMGVGNIEIGRLTAEYITIEGGAGSLQAGTIVAEKELDVDMGAGDFKIDKAVLGETDISCGAGSVKIGQCMLGGDLDVSGGVGDVAIGIAGEETDFNYELECGMGELEVFGNSYTALGKDRDIDNGAVHTISLECGIGSITIYGVDDFE